MNVVHGGPVSQGVCNDTNFYEKLKNGRSGLPPNRYLLGGRMGEPIKLKYHSTLVWNQCGIESFHTL